MKSLRALLLGILVVRFVVSAIVALVITGVAFLAIPNLVQSGQIPAAPLGLEFASMGIPATVLGVPTTYVIGILLFDLLIVFGNGGGSSSSGGGDGGY
jgi:hypothetical protein